MKRLALVLLSLLLLCGCAPQAVEEKPSFSLPPLEEERGEAAEGEAVVLPLNQKTILDFDSREEFATDSVRVTLKASASDHLDPPTAEDFPGIDLSRIEYLIPGGYDPEVGRDWETYFTDRWEYDPDAFYAEAEHDPELFRWRLRLYFEHPGEETARNAVDVLNEMEAVAEVENAAFASSVQKEAPDLNWEGDYDESRLEVTIFPDYSNPHDPYTLSEFSDFSLVRVENHAGPLLLYCSWKPNETGLNQKYIDTLQFPKYKWFPEARFQWTVTLVFPAFLTNEQLEEYARLLQKREDVQKVSLAYSDGCVGFE